MPQRGSVTRPRSYNYKEADSKDSAIYIYDVFLSISQVKSLDFSQKFLSWQIVEGHILVLKWEAKWANEKKKQGAIKNQEIDHFATNMP